MLERWVVRGGGRGVVVVGLLVVVVVALVVVVGLIVVVVGLGVVGEAVVGVGLRRARAERSRMRLWKPFWLSLCRTHVICSKGDSLSEVRGNDRPTLHPMSLSAGCSHMQTFSHMEPRSQSLLSRQKAAGTGCRVCRP